MTVVVSGIRLAVDAAEAEAFGAAKAKLRRVGMLPGNAEFAVYRRSVDARHRDDIAFVYTVLASGSFPENILERASE